jgi:hypothetical protein
MTKRGGMLEKAREMVSTGARSGELDSSVS